MIYGYCRVSTKGQAKDGNSLEAQEQEILSRYSDALIYKEAYTGTTTDRPVFNEVIQQMQENDIRLKDAYRKAEGLLTSAEIIDIGAKY